MAETIAGVTIPDSKMCRETTDFICETESPLLYHHSRRTYLFGMLHGQLRGQHADPELLYVAAMYHDLGMVEGHMNLEQRFEVDGADAARAFLDSHQVPHDDARRVWRGPEEAALTPTEYTLLRCLMLNAGRVVTRAQILDQVWHYDFDGESTIVEWWTASVSFA